MTEKLLEIEKIRTDGETQPRDAIDLETVAEYAEALQRGEKFPAVDVMHDGKEYWLARGFHRWHAHRKAGIEKIACVIMRGTVEDARWHAYGDNVSHGLRRTRADIERAVRLALGHPKGQNQSDVALGKYLGVSHATVANWRKRLETPNPRSKGGDKLAETAPKPLQHKGPVFRKDSEKTPDDGPPMDPPNAPEPADPKAEAFVKDYRKKGYPDERIRIIASMRPEPMRAQVLKLLGGLPADKGGESPTDELGMALPEKVHPAFARRGELQDLMTTISRIKTAALQAHETKDPLYADLNPSQFQAECENVYRSLRALKPYAVCPYCAGKGCRACLNRGWVGEFVYAASPAAQKGKK